MTVVAGSGCAIAEEGSNRLREVRRLEWYLTPSWRFWVRWRKGWGTYEGPGGGSIMERPERQRRRRDIVQDCVLLRPGSSGSTSGE